MKSPTRSAGWLCVQRREGRVMGLNESEPRLVAFTSK